MLTSSGTHTLVCRKIGVCCDKCEHTTDTHVETEESMHIRELHASAKEVCTYIYTRITSSLPGSRKWNRTKNNSSIIQPHPPLGHELFGIREGGWGGEAYPHVARLGHLPIDRASIWRQTHRCCSKQRHVHL